MGKTALKRLEDGQLFHLLIGNLLILGLFVCAAALTELAQRILGPLSGAVFFLLSLVMFFVVLVFLYTGKCDKAVNKLVDLADLAEHHIETPQRLQSGYMWLRKIRAIEYFCPAVIIAAFAAIIAGVRFPGLGLEEMENFARYSLRWIILHGALLALLILASWVAGHFAGRSRRT